MSRRTIAVFLRYYLPGSMTFVRHQLAGVAGDFRPIVLASDYVEPGELAWDPLFLFRRTLATRIRNALPEGLKIRPYRLGGSEERECERVLRREQVALVHAHFGPYALEILPVARRLGLPLIVTFHGFDASRLLASRRYRARLPELFDYARVIAVSRSLANRLLRAGADESRLTIHYVGVPTERFAEIERPSPAEKLEAGEPILISQIANLVPVKGHEVTLRAFARLLRDVPNCRLTLAGTGPLRGSLEAMCRELGVGESVRFTGALSQSEVADLLARSDVFVMHSVTSGRGEIEGGAPLALAEAMSTGLTVVGSKSGGIPELVEDGVDGFLVPEGDVDAYASTLRRALGSDGGTGRRAAEKIRREFDLTVQNRKLVTIYEEELAG